MLKGLVCIVAISIFTFPQNGERKKNSWPCLPIVSRFDDERYRRFLLAMKYGNGASRFRISLLYRHGNVVMIVNPGSKQRYK